MIIRRFVERDHLYNKIKNNSEHIADEQINNILDNLTDVSWCDITFRFITTNYGIKTIIIDNITECDMLPEDLPLLANDFYQRELQKLNQSTVDGYISKIKEILYSKDKKGA